MRSGQVLSGNAAEEVGGGRGDGFSQPAVQFGALRGQLGVRPSQRELADLTGLDPVYVSKLVRALERDGFVTRSVKAADPRAVELALTERGAAAVEEGVKAVYELRERLTRPLGGNDGMRTAELAAMLRDLLDTPEADPITPSRPPGSAPSESGVVDEQAADVAAVQHVPVALVDLVE
jgi:DNA-binding MarR family transcriptional regulator